jgi:hypothetical protein
VDGQRQQGDPACTRGRSLPEGFFQGAGGTVEYKAEFVTDEQQPCYTTDAPETGGGPIRSVIVFRLRPVDQAPQPASGLPPPAPRTIVSTVSVEERNTEKTFVEPSREPYEAERKESELVHRFKAHLKRQGHTVTRLMIQPAGEAKPLFSDLWVEDLNLLVEAKGSVDRRSIRMAIGPLIDYRRFAPTASRCAVLLPSPPRADLAELVACSRC